MYGSNQLHNENSLFKIDSMTYLCSNSCIIAFEEIQYIRLHFISSDLKKNTAYNTGITGALLEQKFIPNLALPEYIEGATNVKEFPAPLASIVICWV